MFKASLWGILLTTSVWAGGGNFQVGCVGVCGIEQTVFDGQTTCVAVVGNVATDRDLIHVSQIRMSIFHVDGTEVKDNILVPGDTGTSDVFVSPHSEFQVTSVLRPHPADLGLDNQRLFIEFEIIGNVIFNAFTPNPTSSGADITFAGLPDFTHVLVANPATCTTGTPLALSKATLVRHARIRNFHHLRHMARPITPIERARLEAALGHR